MSDKPKKGQQITLELTGYDADGLALGEGPNGFQVCTAGGVAGERVRVTVEHVSPHRPVVWARLDEVEQPAPARAREHGKGHRCGGCDWAHLGYGAQLEVKARWAEDVLREVGAPPEVLTDAPLVPSPRPEGYRNRGKYVIRRQRGDLVLGGYVPRSHRVVSTLGCPVMAPEVDRAARALARLLGRRNVSVYDERTRQGLLRYAGIRVNHRGQLLVTVVVTEAGDVPWDLLGDALAEEVDGLTGLTLDLNPEPGNVLFTGAERSVWGEPELVERYGEATVRLSGHGFGQVNREVATALYAHAAAHALAPLADGRAPTRVWDLFSGAGALSQTLALADSGVDVVGVERDERAVELARRSAAEAGLDRCTFRVGDANRLLAEGRPDVVVVNPPRTGCRPALLEAVAAGPVSRVVYVSCSPQTLTRDLRGLGEAGFSLSSLLGFDMLPQTPHLELVAVCER